jgi:hypothetical protein
MDHDAIPTLPGNPVDSYQSQLNCQYGPASIVDVLDNSLPAGGVGGFSFHDSFHEHPNNDEAVGQSLSPVHEHDNVETVQYGRTDYESRNGENTGNHAAQMHGLADQMYQYRNPNGFQNAQPLQYSCQQGHTGAMFHQQHVGDMLVQACQQTDHSWQCDRCGVCNSGSTDRCDSCQSHSNHLAAAATRDIADKQIDATIKDPGCGINTSNKEDWLCDKCNQASARNKKRCMACNRWRNGKRTNTKFGSPILASDLVQPDLATVAAVTAAGKWICHKCSAVNHKSRCSVCQSWKGARRHNLPKRNNVNAVSTNDDSNSTTAAPWACDKCNQINGREQTRCSSCQRWKDGKRLNIRAKSNDGVPNRDEELPLHSAARTTAQPQVYNIYPNWQCKCGNANRDSLRCKSCKSWKNSREQQQYQQHLASLNEMPEYSLETVTRDTTKPIACTPGNYTTITTQEYLPLHPLDQSVAQMPEYVPYSVQAAHHCAGSETQPFKVDQKPEAPWICPRCSRENLASKSRCGGCQKWKGTRYITKTSHSKDHLMSCVFLCRFG